MKRENGNDVDGGEDDDEVRAGRGGEEGEGEREAEMAPPKTKGRKPALKSNAPVAANKVKKPRAKRVKGGAGDGRQDEADEERAARTEVTIEEGGKEEENGDVPVALKAEDSTSDLAPADEDGSFDEAAGGDGEAVDGKVVAAEMSGGDDGE